MIPINPGQAGKQILAQKVYAALADIPEPVDMIEFSVARNTFCRSCARRWRSSRSRR